MVERIKSGRLSKLCAMVAAVAIVFGGFASTAYGQETSAEDEANSGPLTVTECGPACDATRGYAIGGKFVLAVPGGTAGANTALGYGALTVNTTGFGNTASGVNALTANTTGNYNTASGYDALFSNTTGSDNTANGYEALWENTTGTWNTASGWSALRANTTGYYNTASGYDTLYSNTTGFYNMASGAYALLCNSTGSYDTASGYDTLNSNTTGSYNTASGWSALYANSTGSNNAAIGYSACYNVVAGSNVTCIGSGAGPASDIPGPATYISGIYGGATTGSGNPLVCIDSTGLLGTVNCASNGAPSAQQEVIDRQQQQIQTLQKQNDEFQRRLSSLEALITKN
jgi:hypothetical protein